MTSTIVLPRIPRHLVLGVAVSVAFGCLGIGLAPAANAESCGKVNYADGTVGPSVCPDGMPNSAVKSDYQKNSPAVMALKSNSTRAQLKKAVKSDCKTQIGKPTIYDAIEYQAAEFGWSRAKVNPTVKFLINSDSC